MIPVEILLEKGATYRKLDPGEVIFHEGTHASYYYQIVSGRVRWCNLLDDGREVLHKVVEPGDIFGELPLFDGEPYASSAIADTPAVLLRLRADTFHEILKENSAIHFAFSKSMVSDLRFKFMLTDIISRNCPEDIITQLIQYLNQEKKLICQECNRLMLTRQQLANMTGLRVETIIRAIKNMEKEERLSIVKGKVFVPADGI
ncbi:Crp/Fnr family transcriptional regulator [Sphingobacterium wenxiniae]|uniref:cAMP-binding domain of CRP or a regulatory subunit of cAMP-dependent protein kinases n=1 Tax=Sphingobacterium wenxiniae TaxID=683125 RepID=A0A1I6T0U9_9SPHI|nr:Crp/Fnr family transcriptional regulator [Sphingobacterium wenxiniae]SFS82895.1 cAMP-binding domain of CRP or a regulatory subunit of cAMP-dependent protein kinases [Sphingobacterium wenxiniae]